MVAEALQQYRDYFEDDESEAAAFEYLDNLSNRDRIRFMEIFEDHTADPLKGKGHAMIQKREYNPELSSFNNVLLDLIDFKDRVRPLANDLSLMDISQKYQSRSMEEAFGVEEQELTQEHVDAMTDDQKSRAKEYNDMVYDERYASEISQYEQE